jgi:Asp-tRNA(Asn)/Glu-tRNA(Gln) amidotransferase A subunit family amidase
MGPLAEGSDFAGSIRIPAAFCGVVGLKPSNGRVPVYPDKLIGHPVPFISGPITRTVRDAAAMLDALVGPDDRDPRALPHTGESFERAAAEERSLAGLRLGWNPDLGCVPIDPDVARLCGEAVGALEGIGVAVEEDSTSFAGTEEAYSLLNAVLRAGLMAPYLPERADEMDPLLVKRSELANARTATDVGTAEILQSDVYHRLRKLFERYDVLATPTTATPPFELGRNYPDSVGGEKVESPYRLLPLTYVFNLSGHPAISVPAGWTDDGRPVGLQLIGRPRADAELLSIAAAYERARPWAQRWPKLPERAPAAQG